MEQTVADLQAELGTMKVTLEEYLSGEKNRVDQRVQEVAGDLRKVAHDTHSALTVTSMELGSAKEKIRIWEEWADKQKREGETKKAKSLLFPKNMIFIKIDQTR